MKLTTSVPVFVGSFLFVIPFASLEAPAIDPIPGPVLIEIRKIYDGDTITQAVAHVWPGVSISTSVRLDKIDTPEIRGKCKKEKDLAIKARDMLKEILGNRALLFNIRWGKYAGRVLGQVKTQDGRSAAAMLIKAKLARPYSGGARKSWCD